METGKILNGWKEIESWLGLTRKTILRQGYPVAMRGRGATPYASVELLERHGRMLAGLDGLRMRGLMWKPRGPGGLGRRGVAKFRKRD